MDISLLTPATDRHHPFYGTMHPAPSTPAQFAAPLPRQRAAPATHVTLNIEPPLVARHSSDAPSLRSAPRDTLLDPAHPLYLQLTSDSAPRLARSTSSTHRSGLSVGLGLAGYSSPLNILLVFVPLGIASTLMHVPAPAIFIFNFLAMLPLAMLLGKATEDVAAHFGDATGALLNVTFGNCVELILSVSALRSGKFSLVRSTITGSILSNLLLVLGSAFFFGGLRFHEQRLLSIVCEANADLLAFSVLGLAVPAIFAVTDSHATSHAERSLQQLSLVTSVGLLLIYVLYIIFQLRTHADLYNPTRPATMSTAVQKGKEEEVEEEEEGGEEWEAQLSSQVRMTSTGSSAHSDDTPIRPGIAPAPPTHSNAPALDAEDEDGPPPAPLPVATALMVLTVALITLSSDRLVATLEDFSREMGVGEKFIASVLLPVVGNAVEHLSAILVARAGKIDLAVGIACGSCIQIALFAAPVLVVVSWVFDLPRLCLNFDLFDTVLLSFAVLTVNATLRDSRTNWLEGAVLIVSYFILATAFFFME